jgi:hypothetical protein
MVLMGTFWTCQHCGRDLCNKCHGAAIAPRISCQDKDAIPHCFVQATQFVKSELAAEIAAVENTMNSHNPFNHGEIALNIQQGSPLVLPCKIEEPLRPQFFIDRFKGVPCDVITSSGRQETSTVDKFFMDYDTWKSGKKLQVWLL